MIKGRIANKSTRREGGLEVLCTLRVELENVGFAIIRVRVWFCRGKYRPLVRRRI